MYNKRQSGAENCGREPLASNQVVGGSSPSGRAKVINDLTHFRTFESSQKNKNIKVVIGGWGAIVGNVFKSGWFAYRPTILDIFPQRISTDAAWKTS